jgi:hypothetical protein
LLEVYENGIYECVAFWIARDGVSPFTEKFQGQTVVVFLPTINFSRGNLIADAFTKVLEGNDWLYLTVLIHPVFQMMLVSALMM